MFAHISSFFRRLFCPGRNDEPLTLRQQLNAVPLNDFQTFIGKGWSIRLTAICQIGPLLPITQSKAYAFTVTDVTPTSNGYLITTDADSTLLDHGMSSDYLITHPIEVSEIRYFENGTVLGFSCKAQKRDRRFQNRWQDAEFDAELSQQSPDSFTLHLSTINEQATYSITRKKH